MANPVLMASLEAKRRNDPRFAIAQQAMSQGTSMAPVQSWQEGLARALQSVVGAYMQKKGMESYKTQQDQALSDLQKALAARKAGEPYEATNPDVQEMLLPYEMANILSPKEKKPDYTIGGTRYSGETNEPLVTNIESGTTDLTPEEVSQYGFPKGSIVQRKKDGSLEVVSKPPEEKKRDIETDALGRKRYVDTGELVFPRVETPAKEEKGPLSQIGKLRKDLKDGFISEEEYNAGLAKIQREEGAVNEITLDSGEIIYSGNKQLPANKAELLSEGKQIKLVTKPLEDLVEGWSFGPVFGLLGASPYATETRKADADLRRASQVIGKYMEGGVLRKEDEEKYRKMLPNIKDTKEVAEHKLEGVIRLLEDKHKEYIRDFGAAGYDVSGFVKQIDENNQPGFPQGSSSEIGTNFDKQFPGRNVQDGWSIKRVK